MGDKKTILIVGRSGNGKTSLAKSISGLQTFKIHHLDEEVYKKDPYLQIKQYDGTRNTHDTRDPRNTRYNVIVCPCIGDGEEDARYPFTTIKKVAQKTVSVGEESGRIDAIVFAMKYGVRYTKQESDAVDIVKKLFVGDVFAKRVIIAFSFGDLFVTDNDEETKETFDVWCRRQQGSIKRLFEEVNYRCVLFDNKAKAHDRSLSQLYSFFEDLDIDKELKLQVVSLTQSEKFEEQIQMQNIRHEKQRSEKQNEHIEKKKEIQKEYEEQRKLQQTQEELKKLKEKQEKVLKKLIEKQEKEIEKLEKEQREDKKKLKKDQEKEKKSLKEKQEKEQNDSKKKEKNRKKQHK